MVRQQSRRPGARRHHIPPVLLVIGAMLASMAALVFPMSTSASAIPISYTIINNTGQVLYYDKARIGAGTHCTIFGPNAVCDKSGGRDFSSNVSPTTVQPGGTYVIQSSLEFRVFRQGENIDVSYQIGTLDAYVATRSTPHDSMCKIEGKDANLDRCNAVGSPNARTFRGSPRLTLKQTAATAQSDKRFSRRHRQHVQLRPGPPQRYRRTRA